MVHVGRGQELTRLHELVPDVEGARAVVADLIGQPAVGQLAEQRGETASLLHWITEARQPLGAGTVKGQADGRTRLAQLLGVQKGMQCPGPALVGLAAGLEDDEDARVVRGSLLSLSTRGRVGSVVCDRRVVFATRPRASPSCRRVTRPSVASLTFTAPLRG